MSLRFIEAIVVLILNGSLECCPNKKSAIEKAPIGGGYPWQVSLYFEDYGDFCLGTLISLEYVLTTATCVKINFQVIKVKGRIIAGVVSTFFDLDEHRQVGYFKNISVHPQFDCLHSGNNIAIIQTQKMFLETLYVRPIDISQNNPEVLTECEIAHWSLRRSIRNARESLSEADIQIRLLKREKFTVLFQEACKWLRYQRDKICLRYNANGTNFCPVGFFLMITYVSWTEKYSKQAEYLHQSLEGGALTCKGILHGIFVRHKNCMKVNELYYTTSIAYYYEYINATLLQRPLYVAEDEFQYRDTTIEIYVASALVILAVIAAMLYLICGKPQKHKKSHQTGEV